jgi:signal transduction histidine kinase
LSSIKMQTQLLHAALAPGSEQREMTEAMLHDIRQVEFVVKGLLDLARPDALDRVPAQLNDVLTTVIRQMAPQCAHRHIALRSQLAPDLPMMSLDPDRLSQAILNVVANAVEASREGDTVEISSRFDADQRAAIVVVDDSGVGLSDRHEGRAFEAFVTTKPGGVGLGLVNARAILERHDGTITLERRTPSGTRATLTLPVS